MLFPPAVVRGIGDGTVTLAFRRWEVPRARPGGRQRTAAGVVAFDAVEVVDRGELTDDEARAAGFKGLDELLAFIDRRANGTIYRIRLRLAGPDPRVGLRDSVPDPDQLAEIERRLARLDRASRHGPWTEAVLRAIDHEPGVSCTSRQPSSSRATSRLSQIGRASCRERV